ncbi:gibberellin-regulated protein 6-like isoform X1 [Macadamia integrifolia]|uniref:gibberellin-regulated protein 6-like isoform X1 n=1 Tax=Macadamia integrifolia TaxID=60698 RepID=UPI001C4FA644|nr:gibberellin-regulated protein 6-like isoform X1 [Macadamia integrifolia]
MAMARFVDVMLLVLLAASILEAHQLQVSAKEMQYHLDSSRYGPGSLKSYQCPSQCSRRCGKTQYHKPCMFFCQKCCRKCLCVPPGYYGNKAICPCYNNWKTQQGGPKCP